MHTPGGERTKDRRMRNTFPKDLLVYFKRKTAVVQRARKVNVSCPNNRGVGIIILGQRGPKRAKLAIANSVATNARLGSESGFHNA